MLRDDRIDILSNGYGGRSGLSAYEVNKHGGEDASISQGYYYASKFTEWGLGFGLARYSTPNITNPRLAADTKLG